MPDLFSRDSVPSYKRVDDHMIDPREIEISPEFNGRMVLPDITDLKESMIKDGQLLNVIINKREGRPVLLDGHRRWRAAIELTNEKRGPFEGGVFKLKCTHYAGSPLDCFIVTVKANQERAESRPEDDGYNIMRLRSNFNLTEEDIAIRAYGKKTLDGKPDVKWVRDRAALAGLTPEALEAMRSGDLKPSAAVALSKMSAQIQKAKVRESRESGKKLTVAAIKATTPAAEKPRKVTTAVLREFWEPIVGERKGSKIAALAEASLAVLDDGDLDAYYRNLIEVLK